MKVIGALQIETADHLNSKLPERILTRTRLKCKYRILAFTSEDVDSDNKSRRIQLMSTHETRDAALPIKTATLLRDPLPFSASLIALMD